MKAYIHNGIEYTRDEYFALMFGVEYMESDDKGVIKEYPLSQSTNLNQKI